MKEEFDKIKLKITKDGIQIPSDIDLRDYGINDGDHCILSIDDETGEAKLQNLCDALIDEIEKYDEKAFDIFHEESIELANNVINSTIPQSGTTILSLLAGINSLKLGIFELCKSRDIYSLNVLYRSLLEHFIKINYFFHRIIVDKNDAVGEDYYKFYSKNEIALYGKSLEQINRIVDLEYQGKDIIQILYEIEPELRNYSSKELREKISQYNYKNMIKFIFDKHNNSEKDKKHDILLSIIPEYSELSSYVHGGPFAIRNTAIKWKENEVEKKCCQFARSTFSLFVISKLISLFLFGLLIDKKYLKLHNKINNLWKESNSKIEDFFKTLNKSRNT